MNNLDDPEAFEDDNAEWLTAKFAFASLCFWIALGMIAL